MELKFEKWSLEIKEIGGDMYFVGGCVRDSFIGVKSKDIDLLVTGIELNKLVDVLSKYGKVNMVGESFGIIKFKPFGDVDDYDIALPRTERCTGDGGYRAFETFSDPFLPIEKDLERRDFTINSVAKNVFSDDIVDPFGGVSDIKEKIIRMTNPETFKDDPLRMLRAVQFASRFRFIIEFNTYKAIIENGSRIKEIPFERVLIELDKIVKNGNKFTASSLLYGSELGKHIFGCEVNICIDNNISICKIETVGEFLFFMLNGKLSKPVSTFMVENICSTDDVKICKGLEFAYSLESATYVDAFKLYGMSQHVYFSHMLPFGVRKVIDYIIINKMPFSFKELDIDGNDLMSEFGFEGKKIKDTLLFIIESIYSKKVVNKKEEIIKYLKQNG